MDYTTQIAKHFSQLHFGGNWTDVNLKDTLKGLTWQQATTQVYSFNTIATLTFHLNYFVVAVTKVLEGQPLDANDKYSFAHPTIESQENWENFLDKTWRDAKKFTKLISRIPDQQLDKSFWDKKYGDYFSNLHGIIEHSHYHLGQIVLIKKIVLAEAEK